MLNRPIFGVHIIFIFSLIFCLSGQLLLVLKAQMLHVDSLLHSLALDL